MRGGEKGDKREGKRQGGGDVKESKTSTKEEEKVFLKWGV